MRRASGSDSGMMTPLMLNSLARFIDVIVQDGNGRPESLGLFRQFFPDAIEATA
jgi:hypothetical protein